MNVPLQITYRDMNASEAMNAEIRKRTAGLERYFDRITRCRVVVEAPSQRQRQGQDYRVRVELSVPGTELVAGENTGNQDAYVAMRDAFTTAERELKKYAKRRIDLFQSRSALAY